MKKPKNFIITGHYGNKLARICAQKVVRLIHNRGIHTCFDEGFGVKQGEKLAQCGGEMIIVFGGDGSLLHAVRKRGKNQLPILGVNCGKKGTLMACDSGNVEEVVGKVLQGKYFIEKRSRIAVIVDGELAGEALNEAVIAPEKSVTLMEYVVEKDGERYFEDAADALMVATPTGSTGYARSAGGALLDTGSRVVQIVSVNSIERANSRVLSEESFLRIVPKGKCEVVIDGDKRFGVKEEVVVRKGVDAEFVRGKGILRDELRVSSLDAPASAKLIVALLRRKRDLKQGEIAKICGLPVRTVARSLDLLLKRGIAKKEDGKYGLQGKAFVN